MIFASAGNAKSRVSFMEKKKPNAHIVERRSGFSTTDHLRNQVPNAKSDEPNAPRTQENVGSTDPNAPNAKSRTTESEGGQPPKQPQKSQTELLLEYAEARFRLFCTPSGEPFVYFDRNGHSESWPAHSRQVKHQLSRLFYERHEKPPSLPSLQDAIAHIAAKCEFEGERCELHVRIAGQERSIYVDLCNDDWQAVEISSSGWKVVCSPPVAFKRSPGMKALPVPVRGGSLESLRGFINTDDDSWPLLKGWLLGALNPAGPYPVQSLNSEQGTGKSSTSRLQRELIDPHEMPLRSQPKNEQDLAISANRNHCLPLDNLSSIPNWLSDSLCKASTGGCTSTRTLYSNDEETLLPLSNPVIINGIGDIARNSDLMDRTIFIQLNPIPEDERITERELWKRFDEVKPGILGWTHTSKCSQH